MATLPGRLSTSSARSPSPSPTHAQTAPVANNLTGIAAQIKAFGGDLLTIEEVSLQPQPQPGSTTPISRRILRTVDAAKQFLPGQPRIIVKDDIKTVEDLQEYLKKVHLTKEIDSLLPFMRYIFVQTPSFRHITPLHHQEARERKIIVDEHPGLHLVWYYERIFVKPIPAYFYSPSFWSYIEDADPDVFQASLGFMRSYYFLIQYETDYLLACKIRLIPKKPDGKLPSYEEYCDFISAFKGVEDQQCSRRFHYGELRLSRINRTAFLFRLNLAYFHIYPQWGSFLQHFMAPIITVFAIATVVLNSMQVSLAAIDMGPAVAEGNGWPSFVGVSKWFPIIVMMMIAGVVGFASIALFIMAIKDWRFANKTRRQKRDGNPNAGEKSHGVIW